MTTWRILWIPASDTFGAAVGGGAVVVGALVALDAGTFVEADPEFCALLLAELSTHPAANTPTRIATAARPR
jgi:hypothetical protein